MRSRLLRLPVETTAVAPASTAAPDATADDPSAPVTDDETTTSMVIVDGPGDQYELPGSAVGVMALEDDGLWEDWEVDPDLPDDDVLPEPGAEASIIAEPAREPGPVAEAEREHEPGPIAEDGPRPILNQ